MRPIFSSLPRFGADRLSSSGARYLLHRFFQERHGWLVGGLASRGESWNKSSPAQFFAEHSEAGTEGIFESHIRRRGMSLHDTAVFAATLESSIRRDTVTRLHGTYRVLGLSDREDNVTEAELQQVFDGFMVMMTLNLDSDTVTQQKFQKARSYLHRKYSNFDATLRWVNEIREEMTTANTPKRATFDTTTRVLEAMADRHSQWLSGECTLLKQDLMKREIGNSGRVLLRDFYAAGLEGMFAYTESKDYLRTLGALDETSYSQPSVIISNYVEAPPNCLAHLKFYDLCCLSECQALLSPLDRGLGAPDAAPDDIVRIAENLSSSTVKAPRKLAASLVGRLEEIAKKHAGRVPLHGRLFAQWMHHAFPRDCPFPHAFGTVQLMSGPEYEQAFAEKPNLNASQLAAAVEVYHASGADAAATCMLDDEDCELPWSHDEELFVTSPLLSELEGTILGPHAERCQGATFLVAAVLVASMVAQFTSDGRRVVRRFSRLEPWKRTA